MRILLDIADPDLLEEDDNFKITSAKAQPWPSYECIIEGSESDLRQLYSDFSEGLLDMEPFEKIIVGENHGA